MAWYRILNYSTVQFVAGEDQWTSGLYILSFATQDAYRFLSDEEVDWHGATSAAIQDADRFVADKGGRFGWDHASRQQSFVIADPVVPRDHGVASSEQ